MISNGSTLFKANWVRTIEIEVDQSQLKPAGDDFASVVEARPVCFGHGGPAWKASAFISKADDDIWHFGFVVVVDIQPACAYAYNVIMRFEIVSSSDPAKKLAFTSACTQFDCDSLRRCRRIATLDDLLNPANGYIKDGKLLAKMTLTADRPYATRCYSFCQATDYSDTTLLVGGTQFFVNRGYLSTISPVFRKMLCGQFKESSEDIVTLEEVDPEEFHRFLKATAPKPESITYRSQMYIRRSTDDDGETALPLADTVLFLIRLADRFDVAELMQRCEEHLLSAKDVHIAGKLLAADELNLRMTRDTLIDRITLKSIKELHSDERSRSLSSETNRDIIGQMLKLSKI